MITEFHVHKSLRSNSNRVVVSVRKDNSTLNRRFDIATANEIECIIDTFQKLRANPESGWECRFNQLGALITTYTIESHPEYFL